VHLHKCIAQKSGWSNAGLWTTMNGDELQPPFLERDFLTPACEFDAQRHAIAIH
jgi:hypothetical protein